ncbi:S-layer homology domain-containing protein [Paenibacillus radicis (ex Xue et al. 2023)]|uniref:S-layer homology domain-containing protein n=1 Tax=Paenibacillus radicis (ex Xue et al. 2023) TaxID=2972489 RepID=A0ABT1YTI8_9BACL|nr:S-layer homology domain-containing protein [Paenibacillus radicis (ex Xue et al. 2023)]MCR8636501.1 S-layer homology domain-containing protein [Paenibacillus radicis (ex Xue et al. 2023)]
MRVKVLNEYFRMLCLSIISITMVLSGAISPAYVYATDTVFTQKGSGILGWHATPYGSSFTEARMKSNADWLAANFLDYGYEYINVDGWVGDATKHNANGYITHYKNDWMNDWKYWADYVHSKGLKLGIYYNPSWLHQDIANDPANLKVVGTNIPLKSIIRDDPKYMHQTRYMIDPDTPGSKEYVQGMIKFYISIGVDLLKIDFLRYYENAYGHAAVKQLYDWMREAAGNDIILYYANTNNVNHAADEVVTADLLRASEDWRTDTTQPGVWYHTSLRNRGTTRADTWPPAYNLFDGLVYLSDLSGPGKVVLDGDFSVMSSGGTDAEKKTRISLLAMAGSSIFIGDNYQNMASNDAYYKNLEIIDMNKRGFVGKPLSRDVKSPLSQIWKGQLPDGTWVVALFNREDTAQTRSVDFANDLGLSGNYLVSDMWSHSIIGTRTSYSESIEPHGVRLLKISKLSMTPYSSVFFGSQQVTLNAVDPQAEIRYTTDGSEPNASSSLYTGSLSLNQSTTLRAKIISGNGQGYEAQARFMASNSDPIQSIASGITSLTAPAKGATSITLPSVPSGYTIRIKSSDHTNVISTAGTITPPSANTTVNLVLEVTRTADGVTKDTGTISVIVPGTSQDSGSFILFEEKDFTLLNPSNLAKKTNKETAASGGENLQITFTALKDQYVEFTGNVPAAGTYEVVFGYKRNDARGIFQTYVDGVALGAPVDQYVATANAGYLSTSLGKHTFTSGNHTFKFEIVGKNPAMTKTNEFVIDYIKLIAEQTITEIQPVNVTTIPTVAPKLPSVVTAVYNDSTTKEVHVKWDSIAPSQYASVGSFTVQGAVYSTMIPAVANVTVMEADPQIIADAITSIPAPAKDATHLVMPVVPKGYTIAIQQTYDPSVIDANGTIYPPAADTAVSLVFEVTRTSDGESAATDIIEVIVPAKSVVEQTAASIAAGITSITAPVKDAGVLMLPSVPAGFTIAIKTSSNTSVIAPNGTIVPPTVQTTVNLVLEVTRTSDGSKASTAGIAVVVPAKSVVQQTAAGVAATITEIAAPAKDVTVLTLPTVPEGFAVAIKTSSDTGIIALDGTIVHPAADATVNLVLEVTRISDSSKASTASIAVTVTAKTVESQPNVQHRSSKGSSASLPGTITTPAANNDEQRVIKDEELKQSISDGKVSITVPFAAKEIVLPAKIADWMGTNPLVVLKDKVSLNIPTELIQQLTSLVSEANRTDGSIVLKVSPLSEADARTIMGQALNVSPAELKLSGEVYNLGISYVTKDGIATNLTQFNQPMTIRLKVDPLLNTNLAGIYYIADNGKIEYVGGEVVNGELVAEIHHFSKYAVLEFKKSFADVPSNHWAFSIIQELTSKHILDSSVASFEPERTVTRAEFTAMLVRALKLTTRGELKFTDVASSEWYAEPIAIAVKSGIVAGKSENTFAPNAQITREEMVAMIMRAYESIKGQQLAGAPVTSFDDDSEIADWAKSAVRAAASLQFVNGRVPGQFVPKGVSSRAEAAAILKRILK